MANKDIRHIFKNGKSVQLKELNYTQAELVEKLKQMKEQEEKTLALGKVDWNKLDHFYVR